MKDTISLVGELIEEHKKFKESIKTYEQSINDATQAAKLEDASESFIPSRLEDYRQKAAHLAQELLEIDRALERHFDREETALLKAFERHGLPQLASILRSLLAEHKEIRGHLAEMKRQAAELSAGQVSRHIWNAKAWDMRAGISYLSQLLRVHAGKEDVLFGDAEKALRRQAA